MLKTRGPIRLLLSGIPEEWEGQRYGDLQGAWCIESSACRHGAGQGMGMGMAGTGGNVPEPKISVSDSPMTASENVRGTGRAKVSYIATHPHRKHSRRLVLQRFTSHKQMLIQTTGLFHRLPSFTLS